MDVQPINLQQLCDAITSIWTEISVECFQHLIDSTPQSIKAVLKAKVGPKPRDDSVFDSRSEFKFHQGQIILNELDRD